MIDSTKLVRYIDQSVEIQQTRLPSCTCLATSAKRRCCKPTCAQGSEGHQCCCGQPVLALQPEPLDLALDLCWHAGHSVSLGLTPGCGGRAESWQRKRSALAMHPSWPAGRHTQACPSALPSLTRRESQTQAPCTPCRRASKHHFTVIQAAVMDQEQHMRLTLILAQKHGSVTRRSVPV